MSADFAENFAATYERDADKIINALAEPHTVKTRKVQGEWTEVDILYVGEAPGALEDTQGAPFCGKSGKFLKAAIAELIDTASIRVGYTYMLRCRPPMNRDPSKYEIQACTPELDREIAARKPKVIVPLGRFSLEYFTGRAGILAVYGNVMQCRRPGMEHIKIVPCVNPSYVLHADHETPRFKEALQTGARVVVGEYAERAGEGQYYVLDKVELVEELMTALRADKAMTAFDTETGDNTPHRNKFPRLLCLSFSNQVGVGYTVPLDHYGSPWALQPPTLEQVPAEFIPDRPRRGTKKFKIWADENQAAREAELDKRTAAFKEGLSRRTKERARVIAALRGFFMDVDVPKVGQNEKFDRQHIRYTLQCNVEGMVRDTMLTHLAISDVRGTHGLEVLSYHYTGMGGYHKPLDDYIDEHLECHPKKGGSYANIPPELLFVYAGQDADATLRVYEELLKDKQFNEKPKLRRLAESFFPRLSATLADIEYAGAQIDLGVIGEMADELKAKMAATLHKMDVLPQVRAFVADKLAQGRHGKRKADPFEFNPGSDQQVGTILWEYYGCRPTELTDKGLETLGARYARLEKSNSGLSFGEVIDHAIEMKEWSFFSTKADVLEDYNRQGVDFSQLVLDFRESQKLYGTYVLPMFDRVDPEGRVHGVFSQTGTVTGRLCVAADTELVTDKGTFTICELLKVQNASILTHHGRKRKIVDCFFKGREEMFRLTLRNGAWVEGTAGHRVWTPQGWKSIRDLGGEAVCTTIRVCDTASQTGSGIGRIGFCQNSFGSFVDGRAGCQTVQSGSEGVFCQQELLWTTACLCEDAAQDKTFALLVSVKGEQTRIEGCAGCRDPETGIGEGVGGRNGLGKHCTIISHNRVDGARECASVRLTEAGESSIQATISRDGAVSLGAVSTRNNGSGKGVELLREPACVFHAVAPSAFAFTRIGLDCGRNSVCARFVSRDESCSKRSYLLEYESLRDTVVSRLASRRGCACATVFVRGWIDGGLCVSSGEADRGSGWGVSRKAGREKTGSEERGTFENNGLQSNSVHDKTGLAGCCTGGSRYNWPTSEVYSVESVGVRDVWDVGIAEDESYVAQGLIHHNSSFDPNLQNIPPYAKRAYVSRFGEHGVILSADYSQIELRIAACLYEDFDMMKAYVEGADLHTLTAIVISGLSAKAYKQLPSDKKKWWRTLAKRVNFGIVYGIGAGGLVNTLKKEGVFLTIDEAKALLDKFFAAHPALVKSLNALKAYVRKTGYLESFTGRVRRLPEVFSTSEEIVARAFRQAGNFPVQSGAGDMTLMSLVLIHEWMLENNLQSKIILTVHDSIVFDCHVDEVMMIAVKVKEIMQNLPVLSEQLLPGLDWAWLRVPIVAEFDIGVSWGQSVEFDPEQVVNEIKKDKTEWEKELMEAGEAAGSVGYFKQGVLVYRRPESVDELWDLIGKKIDERKVA